MSSSITGGFRSLTSIFSKAAESTKSAFLKSFEKTRDNLRNFNAALFNFEAASFTQQAACLLRIGAGIIMTGSGLVVMDPVLSMSGPFVALSGFDKMTQYGRAVRDQFDEASCVCPNKQENIKLRSVLHMPATYAA